VGLEWVWWRVPGSGGWSVESLFHLSCSLYEDAHAIIFPLVQLIHRGCLFVLTGFDECLGGEALHPRVLRRFV